VTAYTYRVSYSIILLYFNNMEKTTFGWVDFQMLQVIFASPWDFEVSSFNCTSSITSPPMGWSCHTRACRRPLSTCQHSQIRLTLCRHQWVKAATRDHVGVLCQHVNIAKYVQHYVAINRLKLRHEIMSAASANMSTWPNTSNITSISMGWSCDPRLCRRPLSTNVNMANYVQQV